MLKLPCALTVALVACAAPATAERLTLSGTVGTAPVLVTLDDDQDKLAGWYVYLRVGKQIRLEGRRTDGGGFTLDEFAGSARTGGFAGTMTPAGWTGVWRKAEGSPALPVALAENRQPLDGLSGTFRCTAHKADRQFGYRYSYALHLQVAKGTVGRLDLSRRATTKAGDDQGCALGLGDLTQVPSAAGLLFMTEGQVAGPRCTVRVLAAGAYLYFKIGDSGQDGNACHGGAAAMYCSPRSFWTDMIFDRKTSACRPVE